MVAAAKLRKHQDELANAKDFSQGLEGMFFDVESDKNMLVPMSTDKGLCGGVNTYILRESKKTLAGWEREGVANQASLYTYGGKAKGSVGKIFGSRHIGGILDCGGGSPANFKEVCEVAQGVAEQAFGKATVLYNSFVNVISFDTTKKEIPGASAFNEVAEEKFQAYEMEGDEGGLMQNFYEFMLAVEMYQIVHNCQTCEQSSRMTAMDNSSTNADEMYEKLLLEANRVRQAKITKELMEIVGGASAVEDG